MTDIIVVAATRDPNNALLWHHPKYGSFLAAREDITGEEVAALMQDMSGLDRTPSPMELWSALQTEKDRRLRDSDWTQLPDVPKVDKAAWATYRQALRDLKQNTTDPANPKWPTPPE